MTSLRSLPVSDFVEALAARTPAPGGGSASAAAAAMGAALGVMAARFSEGPASEAAAAALDRLKAEILPVVDEDTAAYSKVSAAYSMPKKGDEEKAARKAAIQAALIGAADVPLRAMKLSLRAMEALEPLAATVNRNLISDFAGAALLLDAGLAGCALNVRINAGLMADKERRARLEEEAGAIEKRAAELKRRLLAAAAPAPAKA